MFKWIALTWLKRQRIVADIFHSPAYRSNINWNVFRVEVISTKFCSCKHNSVVMACAKSCSDVMIWQWITLTYKHTNYRSQIIMDLNFHRCYNQVDSGNIVSILVHFRHRVFSLHLVIYCSATLIIQWVMSPWWPSHALLSWCKDRLPIDLSTNDRSSNDFKDI